MKCYTLKALDKNDAISWQKAKKLKLESLTYSKKVLKD